MKHVFSKSFLVLLIGLRFGAAEAACGTAWQTAHQAASASQPMDGAFAMQVLKMLCDLGPRVSGSDAMAQQQQWIQQHFENLGATVVRQTFRVRHPNQGRQVELANLIVQWNPQSTDRILICCHYDTRPYPDQDPTDPNGLFLGANDGASGVGLLSEMGRHMADLKGPFGVDFVFFDAEELVYDAQRDPLFVGSTFFANEYKRNPPSYRYHGGVLIDMIGDKELDLYYERNSLEHAKRITTDIWRVAKRLKIKEFKSTARHRIRDDHEPLNTIAGIPTCDIIDFDYPRPGSDNAYWHTRADTPDKCSSDSMAKVGNVLLAWLKDMEKQN